MAAESKFVEIAYLAAKSVLPPPLLIKRAASLLYEITVDNNLKLTVDPKRPVRGQSAFQTDLCIFEEKPDDVLIPRVVLEFKTDISTHDILTYSGKARKHKQVYPYLRYGVIISDISHVPKRFFVHNESLNFCASLSNLQEEERSNFFSRLIMSEVDASRNLERVAFGKFKPYLFRTEILYDSHSLNYDY